MSLSDDQVMVTENAAASLPSRRVRYLGSQRIPKCMSIGTLYLLYPSVHVVCFRDRKSLRPVQFKTC